MRERAPSVSTVFFSSEKKFSKGLGGPPGTSHKQAGAISPGAIAALRLKAIAWSLSATMASGLRIAC